MRKVLLGSGLLAACIAGSSNAAFLGFGADTYDVTVGANTYHVLDVYAVYSSSQDKILNIFNSNIQLVGATNFYQQNGSWQPLGGSNAADSRVALGAAIAGGTPVGNTSPDGSFLNWNDDEGADPTLPPSPGAGWFTVNPNPANNSNGAKALVLQGFWQGTDGPLGVIVGRFSILADGAANNRFLVFGAQVGTGIVGGTGTFFGQDNKTFKYAIPTPGALALLGLAGIAGRRRRA
ncbi:MAG: hypothetical protein KF724_00555 [Phycisphaeraceae bacterium]|nr:hypothetical protein [Phycisphaeraceae bacterium]